MRLTGKLADSRLELQFTPLTTAENQQYLLHWALTGSDRSTEVKSGENAHNTLHHDFVALEFGRVMQSRDKAQWMVEIPTGKYQGPLALSVWVTPVNNPCEVLQAAGLNNPFQREKEQQMLPMETIMTTAMATGIMFAKPKQSSL
ncbi:hypothetical protein M3P05_05075 [Sansalvadorimonas sp. 2012CJ34-2]|uniref:Uncharacterized protein n=1 Tax=Parendozoicomonas callyspongiae TaxID=2942213 RepID=A0ABT0PDH8_9GAMM|nr:hypothetical protein [Sansalvadorimonas sp. 2012CJ34-2]MCL6269316.1 hypothetical protein [Sansalvadorimonas sp. 2012CJ34-2]